MMDEATQRFLSVLESLVDYWDRQNGTCRDRLEGLAFSTMVMLDGGNTSLPGYVVVPQDLAPHGMSGDIAGALHEQLVALRKDRDRVK